MAAAKKVVRTAPKQQLPSRPMPNQGGQMSQPQPQQPMMKKGGSVKMKMKMGGKKC